MNLKEFEAKIADLKAQGLKATMAGQLDKAEAIKKEIETVTNDFQVEKEKKIEEKAMENLNTVTDVLREEHKLGEENKTNKLLGADSVEYKNAFLKHLTGRDDEMTKLENEAFVHTTQNTPALLPTTMVDQIWDLVSQNHAIMGDITIYRTGTILTVVKHTEIVQGKAKKVAENTANDDEQNTFVKVTLSGNDFSKSVEVSYAEAKMAISAFEAYLTNEIATNLGEALAEDVINTIKTGINGANKVAANPGLSFANVAKAFGALKRVTDPSVYVTRQTLFNRIVTLTDEGGRLIYQPSAVAGVPGTLLGAQVKIEDAVANDEILVGDGKKVVYNMIQDVMVETDKDIKLHKYIYSGYARGEGALIDDKGFSQITITD